MKFSDTGTLTADDMQARLGKLTASNMWKAMDYLKSGKESQARRDYAIQLVAERMTGVFVPHYVNDAMQWGIEKEPLAREWYSHKVGKTVFAGQFLDHPEIDLCGATPDGFVDDGLVEFKCPNSSTYIKWKLARTIPDEHWPQLALQLSVTGRPWVDFCAFDPRMPEAQRGFIRRFEREKAQAYIESVEEHARSFLREVDELFEQVTQSGTDIA